jgi:hypothetical protein
MGLFSFLNRKNESGNAAISMLPVINPVEQADEEVSSVMTTTEPESSENKPLTVSYTITISMLRNCHEINYLFGLMI